MTISKTLEEVAGVKFEVHGVELYSPFDFPPVNEKLIGVESWQKQLRTSEESSHLRKDLMALESAALRLARTYDGIVSLQVGWIPDVPDSELFLVVKYLNNGTSMLFTTNTKLAAMFNGDAL